MNYIYNKARTGHNLTPLVVLLLMISSPTFQSSAEAENIKMRIVKHKNCSARNRPRSLTLTVENRSAFKVKSIAQETAFDGHHQSTLVARKQRKIISINKRKLNQNGGTNIEFLFFAVDSNGKEFAHINPLSGGTLRINKPSETCVSGVTFVIGKDKFGGNPNTDLTYTAFIRNGDYTCCLEADGKPTYKFQSAQKPQVPADAIILKDGFTSTASMSVWVCTRPVYYHYWAATWAWINGYRVSSLPCSVNS